MVLSKCHNEDKTIWYSQNVTIRKCSFEHFQNNFVPIPLETLQILQMPS